jgi:hypothetical protein
VDGYRIKLKNLPLDEAIRMIVDETRAVADELELKRKYRSAT